MLKHYWGIIWGHLGQLLSNDPVDPDRTIFDPVWTPIWTMYMAYMDPDDPRAKSAFLEFVFMQNEPYLTKGIFQHRYLTFPGTAWLAVIGPGP